MRRRLLGVIGHVDHGKTALVRALTGMETDRLPEEQQRGISIALGFAHFQSGDAVIDLVDMPGHERFVRTMIAGATGLDAVLLVVAANEGIKPQTVEHLDIASILGLRRAVIALTKADLVDPATLVAAAQTASALVADAGLVADAPVATSIVSGQGVERLREALLRCAKAEPRRNDGFSWLPIDRAFSVTGFGTVVTGTLRRGRLTVGDEIAVVPGNDVVRVRSLQVHGLAVASAEPGSRVAANLRGIEVSALGRGRALGTPGLLAPVTWLTLRLHAVPSAPAPLANGMRVKALFGTSEVEARLRLLDRDELAPGETAFAQIRCASAVHLPTDEHCVLRILSPPRTVAGGQVLGMADRRLRRHDADVLARLEALAAADQDGILRAELEHVGASGIPVLTLARLAGLGREMLLARLPDAGGIVTRSGVAVSTATIAALVAALPEALDRARLPPTTDGLLAILPGPVTQPVLDHALHLLAGQGKIRQDRGSWRLVRPDQDIQQRSREAHLAARLAETLRCAGLSPPGPDEISTQYPGARALLEGLRRAGVLVRAFDRVQKREFLFHRDAVAEARRTLGPLLAAPPGLLVKEAGAALGVSRKYSVPLLEYFDAMQYTRRNGDRRMLARPEEG